MGRARNSTRLAAVAGRHHIGDESAADAFSMVMGPKRSGRGIKPADLSNDQSLLALALAQLPASDVFTRIPPGRFAGQMWAYQPEPMRVLAGLGPEYERCYLAAGYADALSERVGQQAFIVFTFFAAGDDVAVWRLGETAELAEAVIWLNQGAESAGSQESVTTDHVRLRMRALLDEAPTEPAPVAAHHVLDPELQTILDGIAPAAQDQHWRSHTNNFSTPAFAYDPSSFRVLHKHPLADETVFEHEGYEGTIGYVVAGHADGFGPRAGSEAYVTFFSGSNEEDPSDAQDEEDPFGTQDGEGFFLVGESDTLDDAVTLLNNQLRTYIPEECFLSVESEDVRAAIAKRLPAGLRRRP